VDGAYPHIQFVIFSRQSAKALVIDARMSYSVGSIGRDDR